MKPSGHSPRASRRAMSRASLRSFFRRLPRRLASSVASAMSIRSTHARKRSMNHSTNGQASTARCTGRGSAATTASIFSTHLVLIVSCEPALASGIDGRERDGALVQIDSHERLKRYSTWQKLSVYGAKEFEQPRRSVTASPGPYTVLRLSSCWS